MRSLIGRIALSAVLALTVAVFAAAPALADGRKDRDHYPPVPLSADATHVRPVVPPALRVAAAAAAGIPAGKLVRHAKAKTAAHKRGRTRTRFPGTLLPGHPKAVKVARRYLGVRYVWGGSTPRGFDCSGLTRYVYHKLGIRIPRLAASQYTEGLYVPRHRLRRGDLVFFGRSAPLIHHVGIYVGRGRMIDAPHTGARVRRERLFSDYYGARRLR
ncbi:MAG TPA: C40 family peptidase [Thermoleophilia bacterium]|nr:C40 family peptidase [Thermoleophilia bacterium]